MTNVRVVLIAMLAALLLGACGAMGHAKQYQPANKQLADGIKSYEDGNYQNAFTLLTDAEEGGLKIKEDQILAHKYLAFIHCVSGREKLCREEFREALEIDPAFELKPAEAGHPVWGPVFRGEKVKFAK